MFQPLIEQARAMIQRLHTSAEQGRDTIPESVKVRYSELEAWDTTTHGVVAVLFGTDAAPLDRWRALAERRGALVGEAMRKDIKRGEYFGLIDYFHLAIGILLEFEAMYQHRLASPAPAALRTAVALADQESAHEQEFLIRRAVRAADNRWELAISVTGDTYNWLADMVAAREPARIGDSTAVAQLAANIVERVTANMRRGNRSG